LTFDHNGSMHIESNGTQARPAILAIGTAMPPYTIEQRTLGNWMAASFADRPAVARLVHSLHALSGIETRYSCIPDYGLPVEESCFAPGQAKDRSPTTAERMAIYARAAGPVGADAARNALTDFARQHNISLAQAINSITHLVVVSCTGFFAPGLDFVLTQELELSPTVNRTLIGFMGCAAIFNALRLAHQAVEADPNARVLVVSVELCTLHIQTDTERDTLIAASLFSDAASACVVALPTIDSGGYFRLEQFLSMIKPNTDAEMVWTIGDHGFQLHLSPRIPNHLAEAAPQSVHALFGEERPAFWAIHPGGRAILDRLAQIFALDHAEMRASRNVLRRVGNVSSATLLFVLDELRNQFAHRTAASSVRSMSIDKPHQLQGVAMAFGPGLVIEMAQLTFVADPVSQSAVITKSSNGTEQFEFDGSHA
jgi:predicted naringenin-chalcone synthase